MGLFSMFVLTKLRLCVQSCAGLCRKMWIRNSVQPVVTSVLRSRKALIVCFVVVVFVLYLLSSYLHGGTPKFLHSGITRCLRDRLHFFDKRVSQYDAVINTKPLEPDSRSYLPFVGNGFIGASLDSEDGLFIKQSTALSVPVKYYPVVTVEVESSSSQSASVIDFRSGTVFKYNCFQVHSDCVRVSSQLYAHRTRPSLLVQQIKIHNPMGYTINAELVQMGMSDWSGATVSHISVPSKSKENAEVSITVGEVPSTTSADLITVVAIASTKVPKSAALKGGSTVTYIIVNAVEYSTVSKTKLVEEKKTLTEKVTKKIHDLLLIDDHQLQREHTRVWGQLWQTGVSISVSRAPGALNGDHINSTMYYVLSNTRSPIHEVGVQPDRKLLLERSLSYPDRCYDARHHTLQVPSLWGSVDSESHVAELATRWLVTLQKQGCQSLVDAGAEGVIQGMVLSLGGFQFKNQHLEFNTHPRDLHRDFTFRRISYGNNTHLNVTVLVRHDNKAVLYVALDRNDKPYYACDAGCIDAPVKLSETKVQLPVKLTEPLTAILYITSDHEHMTQLKNVLHVHSLEEAPAHEDHVMALHRHGHRYGGLPTIFWISVVLLVVVFHLFLFKIIYSEYCSGNQLSRMGKYNL